MENKTRREFLVGGSKKTEQMPEMLPHETTLQLIEILANVQARPVSRRIFIKTMGLAVLGSFSVLSTIDKLYTQTKQGKIIETTDLELQKILEYLQKKNVEIKVINKEEAEYFIRLVSGIMRVENIWNFNPITLSLRNSTVQDMQESFNLAHSRSQKGETILYHNHTFLGFNRDERMEVIIPQDLDEKGQKEFYRQFISNDPSEKDFRTFFEKSYEESIALSKHSLFRISHLNAKKIQQPTQQQLEAFLKDHESIQWEQWLQEETLNGLNSFIDKAFGYIDEKKYKYTDQFLFKRDPNLIRDFLSVVQILFINHKLKNISLTCELYDIDNPKQKTHTIYHDQVVDEKRIQKDYSFRDIDISFDRNKSVSKPFPFFIKKE